MPSKPNVDRRDALMLLSAPALASVMPLALAQPAQGANTMSDVTLVVLYPQPADATQFNSDYDAHLALLRKNAGIPDDQTPFSLTRFAPNPDGTAAPFYQMFSMPFPSAEALQGAMATEGMQEVAADAVRISSGGAPVILVGASA